MGNGRLPGNFLVFMIIFIIVLLVLFLTFNLTGLASLFLQPAQTQSYVGSVVGINVVANSVADLYAIQTSISYDPNALRFITAAEGTFLNGYSMPGFEAQTLFLTDVLDTSQPGLIRDLALTRLGGSGVNGDGILFNLYFYALKEGNFSVNINSALMSRSDGSLISSTGNLGTSVNIIKNNIAPVVNAGPDQTVALSAATYLSGIASDDNLPNGNLYAQWSEVSGPGTAYFANKNSLNTLVNFSVAGNYVLRLSVSDGLLSASDDISVMVVNSCIITDAYWSSSNVLRGVPVTLTVKGERCEGYAVSFSIWEDDLLGDTIDDPVNANPVSAVFTNGVATTVWTSEWQPDVSGDPEYYFVVSLVSDESITKRSSGLLNVMLPAYMLSAAKVGRGSGKIVSNPAGINCGTNSLDCTEDYSTGTSVILTAIPSGGAKFRGWGYECSSFGRSSICTLTINADKKVSATFR